jgi:hypothetical protein
VSRGECPGETVASGARLIMDKTYERVKTILTNRRAELERIATITVTV